ncbi:hypothetical protein FQZ97_845700 [compost metagenome]
MNTIELADQVEAAQLVIPEAITGSAADHLQTGDELELVFLLLAADAPEPVLAEEAVEVVLQLPVIVDLVAVLDLVFQIAGQDMPPATMLDPGVALELPFIGVILIALNVQLGVEIALPQPILQHRPWRHQAGNTGQRHGLAGRIDDPHHAFASRGQLFAVLAALAVHSLALATQQQGFVRTQGIDILPVDQHLAGIAGFQRQLAAVEQQDVATQAVAIIQPDRVRRHRYGQPHECS